MAKNQQFEVNPRWGMPEWRVDQNEQQQVYFQRVSLDSSGKFNTVLANTLSLIINEQVSLFCKSNIEK